MIDKSCRGCDGSGWTVVAGVRRPCPVHLRTRVASNPGEPGHVNAHTSVVPPAASTAPVDDWDAALGGLCPACGAIVGTDSTACVACGAVRGTDSTEPANPANRPADVAAAKPSTVERVQEWHQSVAAPAVRKAGPPLMRTASKTGKYFFAALLWVFTFAWRTFRKIFRRHPIFTAVVVVLAAVMLTKDTSFGNNVTEFAGFVLAFYFLGKAFKHFGKKHHR